MCLFASEAFLYPIQSISAFPIRQLLFRRSYAQHVLWKQLQQELASQGDPRIVGDGDIFDYYPNRQISRQQQLYNAPDFDPVREFETRFGTTQTP